MMELQVVSTCKDFQFHEACNFSLSHFNTYIQHSKDMEIWIAKSGDLHKGENHPVESGLLITLAQWLT